ncbi:hypothetical protein TNCV_3890851 [Trichonephila clavipes]|nr:hypothetical protein TNCV_3890851 [Trichonephila clavipes]
MNRLTAYKHFLEQPDPSPIEHFWDMMIRRLHLRGNVDAPDNLDPNLRLTIGANLARNTAGDHQSALSLVSSCHVV